MQQSKTITFIGLHLLHLVPRSVMWNQHKCIFQKLAISRKNVYLKETLKSRHTIFHPSLFLLSDIDFYIGLPRHLHYRASRLDSSNIPRTALSLLPMKYYKLALGYLLLPYSLVARVATHPRDLLTPPVRPYALICNSIYTQFKTCVEQITVISLFLTATRIRTAKVLNSYSHFSL